MTMACVSTLPVCLRPRCSGAPLVDLRCSRCGRTYSARDFRPCLAPVVTQLRGPRGELVSVCRAHFIARALSSNPRRQPVAITAAASGTEE